MHTRNAIAIQHITYEQWFLANKNADNSYSLWVFLNQRCVFLFLLSWNWNPCSAQHNIQVCVLRKALYEEAYVLILVPAPFLTGTGGLRSQLSLSEAQLHGK